MKELNNIVYNAPCTGECERRALQFVTNTVGLFPRAWMRMKRCGREGFYEKEPGVGRVFLNWSVIGEITDPLLLDRR